MKKSLYWISGGVLAGLLAIGVWLWVPKTEQGFITFYRESDRAAITRLLETDWYWLVAAGADFSPEYMFEHRAGTPQYPDNSLSIAVYRNAKYEVAGFVTYHKLDGYRGRIQFLAVDRAERKKGYARKLINFAIGALKKQGLCFIEIAVRQSNTAAVRLYQSVGFVESWKSPDGFMGMTKALCSGEQAPVEPVPLDF